MTFAELVTEVMARTRQTTDEAKARIGREVNDRNRRVTSSIGLVTSARGQVTVPTFAQTSAVTVPGMTKVLAIAIHGETRRVLGERSYDEWFNAQTWAPAVGTPQTYTVVSMLGTQVDIALDPIPDAEYALDVTGILATQDMVDAMSPPFTGQFHDILMHGALSDEWMQLKQDDLSKRSEAMYEVRLADLRMFIAKSAYLNISQGGRAGQDRGPYWPAYSIPRWWR